MYTKRINNFFLKIQTFFIECFKSSTTNTKNANKLDNIILKNCVKKKTLFHKFEMKLLFCA